MRSRFSNSIGLAIGNADEARFTTILAIALLYFVTARFGLFFGSVENTASLIWAPGGIALAAFLCFGFHVWPGVALGAAHEDRGGSCP